MKRTICPYLGLKDDPTTALQFPSNGNFCHHAHPIAPVKGAYQQKYCLTSDHVACPLYQAAKPMALPAALAAPVEGRSPGRRVAALLSIPLLLIGAAALAMAWNTFGFRLFQPQVMPDTGGSKPADNAVITGVKGSGATQNAALPGDNSAQQLPTLANCPLPSGWTTYNVNPTDSLFRLSVIYGVSVSDLQKVNCLGDRTVILPGQVIYVPFIPTNTPIPGVEPIFQSNQPTSGSPPQINPPGRQPTNTLPPNAPNNSTETPIANTNTPVPPSSNTPIPATAVPATPIPTTAVPPSSTPLPPTNTSVPPVTSTTAPSNTPVPPTAAPPTPRPTRTRRPPTATSVPPTLAPPTQPPPTQPPPTDTAVPPTQPPPTQPPPTQPPPTQPPPTQPPPTPAPSLAVATQPLPTQPPPTQPPPTQPPPTDTAVPPTQSPPTQPPPTQPPSTQAPAPPSSTPAP